MQEDLITKPTSKHLPHLPAAASDLISALETVRLRESDIARIRLLLPSNKLDIHEEIQRQNDIINSMKSRILNEDSTLMKDAGPKDISALISSFNSFLNLYLRSMEKLDKDRQMQEIENAVSDAIKDMPDEIQKQYLEKLEKRLNL